MNPAELFHISAAEPAFWWYRGMREILFDTLDRFTTGRPIRRALDAGCGTGSIAEAITHRYGWQVIGLDASPVALHWLSRRRMLAVLGDARALPLPNCTCEVVVSLDLLVHLTPGQESAVLSEFGRVLRPGGLLIVRVAAFSWLRSRHSVFIGESQRFTRSQLVRLATQSGFQVLSCTYLNTVALPLALAKFRLWEPLFDPSPSTGVAPLPAWINTLLLAGLRLERRWLRRGLRLPVGQSILLVAERHSEPCRP